MIKLLFIFIYKNKTFCNLVYSTVTFFKETPINIVESDYFKLGALPGGIGITYYK